MGIAHFSDVKPVPVKRSGICKLSSEFNSGERAPKCPSVQKFLGVRDLFSKRSRVFLVIPYER